MATHDYVIANASGAAVRSDINDVLAAIVSNNSSSSEPADTFAYMWWADTTNNVLKIRNSGNSAWVTLRELDGTMLLEDGSVATPGLAFTDDVNTGIFSPAADQIGFTTGGTERLEIGTSEVVFNDPSNDVDFRVESSGQTHMLFMDAGTHRVCIANSSPSEALDVTGNQAVSGNVTATGSITANGITSETSSQLRGVTLAPGGGLEIFRDDSAGFIDFKTTTSENYDCRIRQTSNHLTFLNGGDGSATEKLRITSDGNIVINKTNPDAKLVVENTANQSGIQVFTSAQSNRGISVDNTNGSYASSIFDADCSRSASSGYDFFRADSGNRGDREFTLRGDGNAYADGTWNNNGADYAEFFESSTGSAIPVGTTVVLVNNKVRAATADDAASSIIGVVRPKEPGQASMTIGNTAWNKWTGKYLTDDFDRFILDEHGVYEWTEAVEDGDDIVHSYESHNLPEGVTVPDDVVGQTHDASGNRFVHYRLNPDYDASLAYVPREKRDEWVIVGLVGQVKILDGQPMNDRWIKMRDVSDTVEEWFIR